MAVCIQISTSAAASPWINWQHGPRFWPMVRLTILSTLAHTRTLREQLGVGLDAGTIGWAIAREEKRIRLRQKKRASEKDLLDEDIFSFCEEKKSEMVFVYEAGMENKVLWWKGFYRKKCGVVKLW